MEQRFCVLREALSSNFRSAAWNLLLAVPLRAARLAAVTKTGRGCRLAPLALALAWVAHGADLE
jgi:hypothetical protein